MFKIPYGISNFKTIRSENYLYVDKTHFIEKIESISYLMLLRPRRFGKNDLITLLFNIGLLTIKEEGFYTKFKIPNLVIEKIYLQYLNARRETGSIS